MKGKRVSCCWPSSAGLRFARVNEATKGRHAKTELRVEHQSGPTTIYVFAIRIRHPTHREFSRRRFSGCRARSEGDEAVLCLT